MGHKSVKDAQRHISSREFCEWMAFDSINPIGGLRIDVNAAMIAATIANVFTSGRSISIDDLMLEYGPKPKPTAAEIEAKARRILGKRLKEAEGG